MLRRSFLIVGHGRPALDRDNGAAQSLRALGAHMRTLEMWEKPRTILREDADDACIDGQPIGLTAKEFALISYLCERRPKVVSRDELLRHVRWEG